jgi:hypothetical protein
MVAGIAAAAVIVAAWNAGNAAPVHPADTFVVDDLSTPAVSQHGGNPESAPAARLIDLYGNEVERAVSDYRIDTRGDIYERHSPQTALPRLTSPVS